MFSPLVWWTLVAAFVVAGVAVERLLAAPPDEPNARAARLARPFRALVALLPSVAVAAVASAASRGDFVVDFVATSSATSLALGVGAAALATSSRARWERGRPDLALLFVACGFGVLVLLDEEVTTLEGSLLLATASLFGLFEGRSSPTSIESSRLLARISRSQPPSAPPRSLRRGPWYVSLALCALASGSAAAWLAASVTRAASTAGASWSPLAAHALGVACALPPVIHAVGFARVHRTSRAVSRAIDVAALQILLGLGVAALLAPVRASIGRFGDAALTHAGVLITAAVIARLERTPTRAHALPMVAAFALFVVAVLRAS
jgi:cation:H+ antiporter